MTGEIRLSDQHPLGLSTFAPKKRGSPVFRWGSRVVIGGTRYIWGKHSDGAAVRRRRFQVLCRGKHSPHGWSPWTACLQ